MLLHIQLNVQQTEEIFLLSEASCQPAIRMIKLHIAALMQYLSQGINYYRIKAEETTGKIVYSKILSVSLGQSTYGLRLYPNPVIGNQVNISLTNVKKGQYNLRVCEYAWPGYI